MEWSNLFKDMGRWQAVVNMVMNLGVPQNEGNLLTVKLLGVQGGSCPFSLLISIAMCLLQQLGGVYLYLHDI